MPELCTGATYADLPLTCTLCHCLPPPSPHRDSVSENLDRKQAELFEEMGVETDADAHAAGAPTFAHVDDLANKRRKLR